MHNSDTRNQDTQTLREGGIVNPARLVKLIQDTIAFFQLDLSGLTVLTEAASSAMDNFEIPDARFENQISVRR